MKLLLHKSKVEPKELGDQLGVHPPGADREAAGDPPTLCPKSHTRPLEYSMSSWSGLVRSTAWDKAAMSSEVIDARLARLHSLVGCWLVRPKTCEPP